jgi:hypothetical protein
MDIGALTILAKAGRRMSKDEARRLESAVEISPEDLAARIKLIAFHFSQPASSKESREHACEHIFWFVLKHPTHLILASEICSGF